MLCFNRLQVKTIFNIISHDKGSREDLSSLACEDDSIYKLDIALYFQTLEPDPILRLKRIVGFGGCSFRDVCVCV